MSVRKAMSPKTGKIFPLTPEMIALRDHLAQGLGYVKRPCSLGPGKHEERARPCWEKKPLDYEHRGRKCSSYHCAPESPPGIDGSIWMHWPEEAEVAAFAIDKGKAPKVEGQVPR